MHFDENQEKPFYTVPFYGFNGTRYTTMYTKRDNIHHYLETNSVPVRSVEDLMVYQPKVHHSDYASCVLQRSVVSP